MVLERLGLTVQGRALDGAFACEELKDWRKVGNTQGKPYKVEYLNIE